MVPTCLLPVQNELVKLIEIDETRIWFDINECKKNLFNGTEKLLAKADYRKIH